MDKLFDFIENNIGKLVVVWGLIVLAIFGAVAFVIIHFLAKWW